MLSGPWPSGQSLWMSLGLYNARRTVLCRANVVDARYRSFCSHLPPRRHRSSLSAQAHRDVIRDGIEHLKNYTTMRVSRLSIQNLAHLVKEERFEEADEVLGGLLDAGVRIEPSHAYDRAIKDVIQRPSSEQKLDILFDWLKLMPDQPNSNPVAYRELLDFLLASPEKYLSCILEFGVMSSSKGFADLIQREVLPVVKHVANMNTYAQFSKDVHEAIERYRVEQASRSNVSTTVFEELSDDYVTLEKASRSPPPSVLDMVQASLPEVLPEFPTDTNEASLLFEDENAEYAAYSSSTNHSPTSSGLATLIEARDYTQAYDLLTQFKSLNAVITPSFIYEEAAQHVATMHPYKSPRLTIQGQVTQFSDWLSLIPEHHTCKSIPSFAKLRSVLFQSPLTNFHLVIRFGLILSAKGYAKVIAIHCVPFVMRFAPPNLAYKFIIDFEEANKTYWLNYKPLHAKISGTNLSSNMRGIAIRSLAYSKRLNLALDLLPDQNGNGYRLSVHTYDVLIRALTESKSRNQSKAQEYTRQIARVEKLLWEQSGVVTEEYEKVAIRRQRLAVYSEVESANGVDADLDIVASLKYLKTALVSKSLPHPITVLKFIQAYSDLGRSLALQLLLRKVVRTSHRSTSLFLFAEMLFYQRSNLPALVIRTFVDHFYVSGVPRNEVFTLYRHILKDEGTLESSMPAPRRICNMDNITLPRGKVWPSPHHCHLIWESLLNLCTTDSAVDRLYQRLLQHAAGGADDHEPEYIQELDPLLPPPSWETNVSPITFTPFIRRLMLAFGPDRGAFVLRHMLKLSLKPTVYHFTEVAGGYARIGDVSRTLYILGQMEEATGKNRGNEAVHFPASPSSATETVSTEEPRDSPFPDPDLVMYLCILRGFVISKNLQGIGEIQARLEKMYPYVPGKDEYYDTLVRDIQALRREVSRSSCSYASLPNTSAA